MKLSNKAKNVYSQLGEDGIIDAVLPFLDKNIGNLNCIEFGAWDGIHLSNSFNLISQGAKAILIESDKEKFLDLIKTSERFPNIIPVNAFITKNGEGSLDNILSKATNLEDSEFDLLSIDVDSRDNLNIWKSSLIRPSILIIEIETRFLPFEILEDVINYKDDSPFEISNLFGETYMYTKNLGYELIYCSNNMIFVKSEIYRKIQKNYKVSKKIHKLFDYRNFIKYRQISRKDLIKLYINNASQFSFKYFLLKMSPRFIKSLYLKMFYYNGYNR